MNDLDDCPDTEPGATVDGSGCSIAQIAPCDGDWKNHGAYVSSVAKAAQRFRRDGLIGESEVGAIVSAAAMSSCGF